MTEFDERERARCEDDGRDLKIGDEVYVKCLVGRKTSCAGDRNVLLLPRRGKDDEYETEISINAIFLRRRRFAVLRRILRRGLRLVRVPAQGDLAVAKAGFYKFRVDYEVVAVGIRFPFTRLDLRLWWGG